MANPYFNAAYYLANNPDLVLAGLTAENVEQHYLQYGAAESVSNPARNPNPWFDASFYLRANPDLIQAGLTPADALAHFANYGVYENRVFSANPGLATANFDAVDYAERYPDVAEAFGIDPEEELTDVQVGQLMGHFLAYGVYEGRTSGNAAFDNAAKSAVIHVVGEDVVIGTVINDTFLWDQTNMGSTFTPSVNGLAGDDTILFRALDGTVTLTAANLEHVKVEALAGDSDVTVVGKGVKSVSVDTVGADANVYNFNYTGDLVETFVVEGTGAVVATFGESADGEADALALTLDLDGSFTIDADDDAGIENLALTVTEDGNNVGAFVNVGQVSGDALTVSIASEASEIFVEINGELDAEEEGTTVTIDASAANGVAIDVVITVDIDDDVIQVGSSGRDILAATDAIDTLIGGAGKDVFEFDAGAAIVRYDDDGDIVGVDTVLDFDAGDAIAYTITVHDDEELSVGSITEGVLVFNHGYTHGKTLTDIVKDLLAEDDLVDAETIVFEFGTDTFVYTQADDLDGIGLIQLAGVSAADLALSNTGITFA